MSGPWTVRVSDTTEKAQAAGWPAFTVAASSRDIVSWQEDEVAANSDWPFQLPGRICSLERTKMMTDEWAAETRVGLLNTARGRVGDRGSRKL